MKIKYSPKRVCKLVNAILVENKRKSIMFYIVVTLAMIFITYPIALKMLGSTDHLGNISFSSEEVGNNHFSILLGMYIIMSLIACTVITYNVFSDSLSKNKVLYKHAIPAMVAEKFTANIIVTQLFASILILSSFITVILFFDLFFTILHNDEIVYNFTAMFDSVGVEMSKDGASWHDDALNTLGLTGLVTSILIFSNRIRNKTLLCVVIVIGVLGAIIGQGYLFEHYGKLAIYDWAMATFCIAIWVGAYLLFKRREIKK